MRILILALMLLCSTAHAARPPIPAEQWNEYTHLWLSRAAVAESGWTAKRDHYLMAFALAHGWRAKIKTERFEHLRFVDHIRNYCAGLGFNTPTRRQEWVRQLPRLGNDMRPAAWLRGSWAVNLRRWRRVQDRMRKWGAGRVRDESKGRVRHWGSPDARLPDVHRAKRMIETGKWRELDLPDGLRNTYYGIVPKAEQRVVAHPVPKIVASR